MTPQEIEKARLIIDALNSVEHEIKEEDELTKTLIVSTFKGEDRKKLKAELLSLLVS